MADHVFISYNRKDKTYVLALADDLRSHGFDAWMDERIGSGALWWRTVVQAVRSCAAFVVVMTPDALESEWVEREIMLALDEKKEVFPLLRSGRCFSILINRQYDDVTNGRMPPPGFYERLGQVAPTRGVGEPAAPAPEPERGGRVASASQPFEPEMILIPAGVFLMGSDPEKDKDAYDDERPQHALPLPDYSIAKTPVTNAQYLAFVQAAGHEPPRHWEGGRPPEGKADHPVVYVSWRDALDYCRWLTEIAGRPYSLPSEAEWEKAASWDAASERKRIYPWGDDWDASRCNSEEGGKGDTTPVHDYPQGASSYGLLDMAGNVWEWTRSLWGKDWQDPEFRYPYDLEDGRESLDAPGDVLRVVRGGSFRSVRDFARCAVRCGYFPGSRYRRFGFRVVSPISTSAL